jgi:hypothetical protein
MTNATPLSTVAKSGKSGTTGIERAAPAWAGQKPQKRAPGLLDRVLRRREPNTYQRCLAVHMYFAGKPSALSDN